MNRIVSFEYIRTIAIIAIVICHCCYGIGSWGFLGKFLGLTFNVIFLVLSAFLIGLSWEKKGAPQYDASFLKARIVKLTHSYYPFIIGMFIFLLLTGYHTTIKDYIMHVTFLPWFDKLSGFGHLWFITMIVICYLAIYTISKLPGNMLNLIKNGGVFYY